MRSRRSGCGWYGLVAVALLVSACSAQSGQPLTPAQEVYATYGLALEIAVISYEEILVNAGAAHAAGEITDEQLANIRNAGIAAKPLLETAKSAMLAYARDPAGGLPSAAVTAAQRAVIELLKAARLAGILQ